MEPTQHPPRDPSQVSLGGLLDNYCDQFEAALAAGETPSVFQFASQAPESIRDDLVRELELVRTSFQRKRDRQAVDPSEMATEMLSGTLDPPGHHPPETITTTYIDIKPHRSGGLGEVMKAEDSRCRRRVALKFIRSAVSEDPMCRDQFLLEAEITSRLDHPGVVPVLGIGAARDGRPFYAMRFIHGEELREEIDKFHRADHKGAARRVELHRLLAHLVAACRTIEYAHSRGVIHRDIKPENIMVGKYGETLVIDWGLAVPVARDARAKSSGEQTLMPEIKSASQLTSSRSGAGTLGYMSPEQLPDSPVPVSIASDVFSLGATLYRLLTGAAAFDAREGDVLHRIRKCEFPAPRTRQKNISSSLEAICLKAMRPKPEERYETAAQLADDLQRWLADEPVSVYAEPFSERVVRWTRRHRSWTLSLVSAALVTILALGLGALMMGYLANNEHEQRLVAQQAQRDAEQARKEGLLAAAELGAKVVGGEIEHRWNVLSRAAESPTLRENLIASVPEPDQPAELTEDQQRNVQAWLDGQYAQHHQRMRFTSLVVTDAQGVQVARSPYSADTVGQWWGFRNYFHGGEQSLEPEPRREIAPARGKVLSSVYQSGASGELSLAFSVPIWSHDQPNPRATVIGILSMSLEMADFTEIDTQVGDALLIDLRASQLSGNGTTRSGLVLHHSRAGEESAAPVSEGAAPEGNGLKWLDSPWLEQGTQLTQRASRRTGNLEAHWWEDCPDPCFPSETPTATAVWPVILRGEQTVPWMIMVRQRGG